MDLKSISSVKLFCLLSPLYGNPHKEAFFEWPCKSSFDHGILITEKSLCFLFSV